MKVNDVLRKGEATLRVLVIKDDICLCINCNAESMPAWMPANSLEDYSPAAAPVIDTNITARQKQVAHERFTMIAPMLVFLTDDKERNRIMNRISEEKNISKQTLRRYLCRYLVYQDIAALAPSVRTHDSALTQEQKNMRWALNKYFYTPKKSKLIVNQNLKHKRFLRYCPVCADEDRKRYGETYWHREHQIIHVDVCPKHKCFLKDSSIPIGSKTTPGLFPAELEVHFDEKSEPCLNEKLVKFINYVLDVFRTPVDMESDVPIGSFLRSVLDDKYLSNSKTKVHSSLLYEDYTSFISEICEPMNFEAFRKIYNNYCLDHYLIYQLAYFQGIPVEKLANRPVVIVDTAMEELYRELAEEYGMFI